MLSGRGDRWRNYRERRGTPGPGSCIRRDLTAGLRDNLPAALVSENHALPISEFWKFRSTDRPR
jgi:hypothetical protein